MKNRIYIISAVFILCAVVLLFRGAWLQLFPHQRLSRVKKNLFEKVVKIKPRRGVVYDRYGRELALSVSSFSLFADPSLIEKDRKAAQKISSLLKVSSKKILKKIKNKNRRFVWIKRHISNEQKKIIQSWNIYGLGFIEEPKRIYPNEALMSQVLGFTGIDGHGLEGLELSYDHLLRGNEQRVVTPKDARGRPLLMDVGVFMDKSRGSDLYLTIDSDLQFVLERELSSAVKKFKAKSAMGLILHAETSEILALAHWPNFNPNSPLKFDSHLWRNRIVSDIFEPGSTFKTFIVSIALKENKAPHQKYNTQKGKLKIGRHIIHEAESHHQYEKLSISEILAVSSNVGSALLALDLTDRVLYSSLKELGFGEKIGVDFPSEGKGIIQSLPWRDILTSNVGFGQGISATPLQMAVVYTAIANGGWLKKPSLLRSTVDLSGEEKRMPPALPIRRIFTKKQTETLTLMLTKASSLQGTGSKARIKGFLTAGKTGTAQKPDLKKGGYLPGKYISSFIGFAPADHPRFVIYIAVDEPSKAFYGSQVAAPVFSSVGSYAVRRAGLAPSFIEEPDVLIKEDSSPQFHISQTKKMSREKTPDFKGLSLRQAFRKAKEMDLKLKIKGSGLVISSVPFEGDPLPKDRKILVILDHP